MTIIVFLVDTSASMAMKTYMGTTVLDFARKTIEEFLKQLTIRQSRDQQRDRYMLMTFDEYPNNVKVRLAGKKE
uniref:VWFA domain-containing protein n=1 Tax=Acrobeloides nanus TaxID=290746 RepID=A0A914EIM0_9BILA